MRRRFQEHAENALIDGIHGGHARRRWAGLDIERSTPGFLSRASRALDMNVKNITEGDRFITTRPPLETRRVAILGAGHGGLALAGYLAHHGHLVALWNRSLERMAPVAARGKLRLSLPGTTATTTTTVALVTTSMAAALAHVSVVLVAVPASGHADVARACASCLRDGQTVLLLPGRTGGALEFHRKLQEADCHAEVLLGEANTFPFAARTVGPAEAVIYGAKEELLAAALPATRTSELIAACKPLLPMLSAARSVLHTGLANLGAILHPVITLLNADRIERGDAFDFYTEGVTPHVADVLADADEERLRIACAYGEKIPSLQEWIAAAYGHQGSTMQAAVSGNPAYVGIKAPATLRHRYLLEDVPTGLIPLIQLGEAAGLALPTLRSLVTSARLRLGGEGWQSPRTLDALGLAGHGAQAIRTIVEHGFAAWKSRRTAVVSSPVRADFNIASWGVA